MLLIVRLVIATALASLVVPVAAFASGGTQTPLSSTACASIALKGPTGSVQLKGPITFSYNVTSCFAGIENVTVPILTVFDSFRPDLGSCTMSWTWTAASLTLKPGETRGFSATLPASSTPNPCPTGTSMSLTNTASVVNDADGTVLGSTTDTILLTTRF